jgi:hypothetical protein
MGDALLAGVDADQVPGCAESDRPMFFRRMAE